MKDKKKLIIGLIILAIVAIIVAVIASPSLAAPIENDVRVEENSELIYYIDVIYDGKDVEATTSSDSATARVYSDYIYVEDKIPDGLIFKGFVSEDEKHDLLNKSYALIMPAVNEPFGLTVIEALYSSCISIISNKSGVYEAVRDYSISCDMNNIDDIAEKIIYVYKNNLKENILSKSKSILKNFTVETYSSEVLKYIENNL